MDRIKKFFVHFLIVLLTLPGALTAQLLTATAVHAANSGDVVINEVMWMGSSLDASGFDEWLELRNTTGADIDLSGYRLTNSTTSSGTLIIPAGKVIPANGYFLIANYDQGDPKTALTITADWVTSSIVLSNSCGQIDLIDPANPITPIDSMGCTIGSKYFAPLSSATKHSLERNRIIADGLLSSSWHERTSGWANLTVAAVTAGNLASPKVANDITLPDSSLATVSDTNGTDNLDTDITYSAAHLYGSWTNFTEDCLSPECPNLTYQYGYALANNGPVTLIGSTSTQHATIDLALIEGQTYYLAVKATNVVNLETSWVYSDGVIHQAPAIPVITSASDVASDNGGRIKVDWASVNGATTYQVNYRLVGAVAWTIGPNVSTNSAVVSGLENTDLFETFNYEFQVRSEGFNGLNSVYSAASSPAQALDNLAPILDPTKIVVGQNKPGSNDTVTGLAGASSEPNIIAAIYFQDPELVDTTPVIMTIGSTGGFDAVLSIGDNQHSQVWIELFDGTNLSVAVSMFTNDIAGPIAPTLTKAATTCDNTNCRVNLDWQSGSADTASYKVNYVVDGVSHQTFEVTTPSLSLDLASGKSYRFSVIGYDQAGNPSAASNSFTLALTKGVKTTITLLNGQPTTATEAIPGALEVSTKAVPKTAKPAEFVPKAEAAAPATVAPAPTSSTSTDEPLTQATTSNRDWIRIFVVIVLLLIIAGSFYALSRSVRETPEETFDKEKVAESEAETTDAQSTTNADKTNRRHRPRRRGR